jgi:AcrR family transcriptional regulator
MELKQLEIIERSAQLFLKNGVKSVTMDDVASNLGISKKTLYVHFKDKNELVKAILSAKIELDRNFCCQKKIEAENAIDELFLISKFVLEQIGNINPVVFFDLKKYHPEGWQIMVEHKWGFILNSIRENIDRGIQEGIYRDNIDREIVARLYVASTDTIMGGEVFPWPEFRFDSVFIETLRFTIRGMASENGIIYLTERIKKEKNV